MKTTILILLLGFYAFAKAQPAQPLDTIYANEFKNVALFFPKPIRQGITGSDNFVFTYNREKEQYFGLLQAKPGKESNLLIINSNGSVFSYIVKYKVNLDKLNYFVPISESIGNEKPATTKIADKSHSEIEVDTNIFYYKKFCSYLLGRNQKIGRIKSRFENIELRVENIVFNKDELYLIINIENKSSLDYDLNFLRFSIKTRQKGKKKSLQKIQLEPIFKYKIPSRIRAGETAQLAYVIPKFSISDDKRAILELNESNGERNIELNISHRFINNPN
ncbi:DUF4138 domain-containing protein [Dokdonia genika]|uniref:DUF4138 domain-containing protein n=1 Tax=Dokdonia genika TaxID=308113 RepID=A0ABV9L8X7_9FLAO